MKLVISGYGKMGKEVEAVIKSRGWEFQAIINNSESLKKTSFEDKVCIDFTTPDAFKQNYEFLCDNFKAAVVGTTGWDTIQEKVFEYFRRKNKTLIYASNFSIGVNIFFKIAELSARLTNNLGDYDAHVIEKHHKEKLDKPSGTANTLKAILKEHYGKEIGINSVRSGYIKGVHEIAYESEADKITLKHEAYSRKGFAEGAVLAEQIAEKINGVYEFRDLLGEEIKKLIK